MHNTTYEEHHILQNHIELAFRYCLLSQSNASNYNYNSVSCVFLSEETSCFLMKAHQTMKTFSLKYVCSMPVNIRMACLT